MIIVAPYGKQVDPISMPAPSSAATATQSCLKTESQHLILRYEHLSMIERPSKNKTSKTKKEKTSRLGKSNCAAAPGSPLLFLLTELSMLTKRESTFIRSYPADKMKNVFSVWTKERRNAYDKESIAAIRSRDIELMRTWHESGRPLQAANNFGESFLHMACRRGFLEVVQFLVDECGHDLWVRDDTGRTPLHDAFWTPEPSPELVDYIVDKDCDLMFIRDGRDHTPLDYARKDHWEFWIDHFCKKDLSTILPKRAKFYTTLSPVLSLAETSTLEQNEGNEKLRPSIRRQSLTTFCTPMEVGKVQRVMTIRRRQSIYYVVKLFGGRLI